MEKWSNWKTLFQSYFFALQVHQDSDTRDKAKDFSMENPCTSRRIPIETWMKELNRIFPEKSEFQLLGISILFALAGASSMRELQNDMFQQINFRNNFVIFGSQETRIVKKTGPKNAKKKVHLLTFNFRNFNRSMNFQFFSALQESQNFFLNFLKNIRK